MKPLDVLFVSMHYAPEPCDSRTSVLASSLARMGHRSTVLTSFPNYPFGKVYDGYKQKMWSVEQADGVKVVRVPMVPDHSKSVFRRGLSYASFFASASVLGPSQVGRPDLVWIHHPPLTTGMAGRWISRLKRAPFVYEVHDLWPETLVSTGMVKEGLATKVIRRTCKSIYRRAAAVVVTSEGMKEHLAAQGVREDKIHVIPQWADESSLERVARNAAFGESHGLTGKFNVLFTGNVGVAQGLDTMLQAALRLRGVPDVQFVVVGSGVEADRLSAKAQALRLDNVKFIGQVPKEELPPFYSWADALLVHLRDEPLFSITVPSKLQTYMHAGRPVLCGVAGDAARIVEESGSGLAFAPGDADEMALAVRRMHALPGSIREKIGTVARNAYEEQFAASKSVARYEQIFGSLTGRYTLEESEEPVGQEQRLSA